jgi:hypothetical protein
MKTGQLQKLPTDKFPDRQIFREKIFREIFPIRVFCALKFVDRAGSCSYMPKVAPDVLDCPCKGERARRARALGHDASARQSQLLLHQSGLGLHRHFDRAAAADVGKMRVEEAPRRAPSIPATAPISGRPSSVTGRKYACRALIGAAASAGEIFRHSASSRACAPLSGATSAGSTGTGPVVEIAHTHVVPSARGNSSGVRISPLASRHSRNSASAGMVSPVSSTQAMALVAPHRRQQQPARSKDRP